MIADPAILIMIRSRAQAGHRPAALGYLGTTAGELCFRAICQGSPAQRALPTWALQPQAAWSRGS
jgi:hypothetical protein